MQLLVGLGCWLLAGCGPPAAREPIWIGHLAPFSGPDRAQGEQARQGIELAVTELASAEKKAGARPIQVLHVDCRNEEAVRAETVRLLTVNRVSALIGSLDGVLAERLVREAQPYGVPVVLTGEAAGSRNANVFDLGVSASYRGQLLAQRGQKMKVAKVGVVSDTRLPLGVELASSFAKEYRKDHGGVVKEWSVDPAKKDEPDFLTEVARWQPDALLLAAAPPQCLDWAKQLHQANVKGTVFYGGEEVGSAPLLPNTSEMSLELATVWAQAGLTAKGQEWFKKYEAMYGEAPDYFAAQAYDGVRLLVEVLQPGTPAAGQRQRERVAEIDNFESLTGPLRCKDRQTLRKVFLLELVGRDSKVLQTIDPPAK